MALADRTNTKTFKGYDPNTSVIVDMFDIDVEDKKLLAELSLLEIYIQESLLSPMPSMTIKVMDTTQLIKNLFYWKVNKGQPPKVKINLINPYIDGKKGILIDNLRIYRLDNRRLINYNAEEFNIHMVHDTAFNNMTGRMSHHYKKTELSKVVEDAMLSIGLSGSSDIEKTDLIRNYVSNNQHPYQVIAEIADMAMKGNRAPFLHYMTFENVIGKQYFKSLNTLVVKNKVTGTYKFNEAGRNKQLIDPYNIMSYEFPCDFDTLLDMSQGILHNQKLYKDHKPSVVSINPFDGEVYLVDGKSHGNPKTQGFGGTLNTGAWSNINLFETSKKVNSGSTGIPGLPAGLSNLTGGIGGITNGISSLQSGLGLAQNFLTGNYFGAIGALFSLFGGGEKPPVPWIGIADQPSSVEKYFHTRPELLAFLHRERVDLKIVVPFSPERHVGDKINVEFYSKREKTKSSKDFGSGEYIIVHMTHSIKVGSYGTTTFECIKIKDTHAGSADPRYSHQRLMDLLGVQNNRGR